MAADAVSATTSTAFKDLVETLVRRQVSGLPVLSRQGRVVGVVRAADLLMKEELRRG